jgi:hypothetical protein
MPKIRVLGEINDDQTIISSVRHTEAPFAILIRRVSLLV